MKPDAGRDAERHAAEQQREHAADGGERDAGEDEERLPHRVEGREEQQEDQAAGTAARRSAGARGRARGSRTGRRTRRGSPAGSVTTFSRRRAPRTSSTKPPMSRPRTLPSTMMRREPLSWLISAGPSISSIRAELTPSGHALAAGRADQEVARCVSGSRRRASGKRTTSAKRRWPSRTWWPRRRRAPRRRHDVGGVDAVAGELVGLDDDLRASAARSPAAP